MPLAVGDVEHNEEDFALDPDVIAQLWRMEERHFWHRARNRWIHEALLAEGVRPPARVLEVGCGSGAVSGHLHEQGYRVVGVDTAERLVRKAHDRHADVSFFVSDVRDLPASESDFDVIGFFDVLEHVDDPAALVRVTLERARPGALVVATVPALRSLHSVIDDLSGHKKRYELGELSGLLATLGITSLKERGIFRFTTPLQKLSRRDVRAAADLDANERKAVMLENLRVPWAPLNAGLGVLCALERWTSFAASENRPGASLLVTGRAPARVQP